MIRVNFINIDLLLNEEEQELDVVAKVNKDITEDLVGLDDLIKDLGEVIHKHLKGIEKQLEDKEGEQYES